jgi:hypothetical protein
MLGILTKRRAGPSKINICHLFHLFCQAQIRLASPHDVGEPWARPDDIDISAMIGHAHYDNSRLTGNRGC